MTEMVERVSRAIYDASPHNKPFSLLTAFQREKAQREAAAAIEAMRSPTAPMMKAGAEVLQDEGAAQPDVLIEQMWWNMIYAALPPDPPPAGQQEALARSENLAAEPVASEGVAS